MPPPKDRGYWTPEETEAFVRALEEEGDCWGALPRIARKLGIPYERLRAKRKQLAGYVPPHKQARHEAWKRRPKPNRSGTLHSVLRRKRKLAAWAERMADAPGRPDPAQWGLRPTQRAALAVMLVGGIPLEDIKLYPGLRQFDLLRLVEWGFARYLLTPHRYVVTEQGRAMAVVLGLAKSE